MRALAERLAAAGYYSAGAAHAGPRQQCPAGSRVRRGRTGRPRSASVRDTYAAGSARDVRSLMVGYSNGGALSVKYTLDAERERRAADARIASILLCPMMGVTPFARLASLVSAAVADSLFRSRGLARRPARVTTRSSSTRFPPTPAARRTS